jgi:hypothetical protein
MQQLWGLQKKLLVLYKRLFLEKSGKHKANMVNFIILIVFSSVISFFYFEIPLQPLSSRHNPVLQGLPDGVEEVSQVEEEELEEDLEEVEEEPFSFIKNIGKEEG